MDAELDTTGLTILRASRLEALVPPLHDLLAATRPDDVLAAQTVIAAHPGMKQWLAGALARHVGPGRIVANLDVRLPSAWLDGLAETLLGQQAVALPRYRRQHLRWTLHAMLAEPARHGVTDPRVLDYLGNGGVDERALRRFQLADRLARVYSQYLVYRTDWLQAWEAGKWPFATAQRGDARLQALERKFVAPLWRDVAGRLGEHRGQLMQALVGQLATTSVGLAPLHVIGLSHLPPLELEVLRHYARIAPVFLYVPDPCREYWGGLYRAQGDGRWRRPAGAAWTTWRETEDALLANPDAIDWSEQEHPLLARWGRMGQQFFAALAEGPVREDTRHWQDAGDATPENRLQRLQESIRRLDPALMREDATAATASTDASLRIHACHTRQRELEVLRDALLRAIEDEGVRAGDIVVMAPDIQAYLPLIPAVFGEAGSARERLLPYHLADVPVARSHPLFQAFATLLGLGGSRITAPEVADLLGVPEVRRALALDEDAAGVVVEWLRNSRAAWALDGAHKAALALPARSEYSFAWAMDRMIAGYLMAGAPGEDADPVELPDRTWLLPLSGIEGPAAAALGSLDRLLCELQAWRDLARAEHVASDWAERLRKRVDALFRIDHTDADARAALSVLHRAITMLAAEPARNGEDPVLGLPVVRELLRDALAAAPERQRFLMGGVTFCGMVPQRAIPFDVVCVLGLDEGTFPRQPSDGGIDLMARLRRRGDRDVPGDDRYLFLETMMSARRRLHLSFIGQDARDGKHRNPASPLAELMAELDRRAGIAPDDHQAPRPWLVRHPLQPFDRRYFDGAHPALFSYSKAFAGMRGDGRKPLPRLRDGAAPGAAAVPDPIPLTAVAGYFKDPAKALLKDHLQVALDALDDDARLPDEEPLDGIAPLHTVARRVFFEDVLPAACADPAWQWDGTPPAWVLHGGVLPPGADGLAAWEEEVQAVRALLACARDSNRFAADAGSGACSAKVDVALLLADGAPSRITGTVRNVFPLAGPAGGRQVVFAYPSPGARHGLKKAVDLDFKARVPAFLQWALLRLDPAHDRAPVRLTMLAEGELEMAGQVNAWDEVFCAAGASQRGAMAQDLRARVAGLVGMWQTGCAGLSRYYPKTGWAVLSAAKAGQDVDGGTDAHLAYLAAAARTQWAGSHGGAIGERDYAPGYARLLEGDLVFGDADTDPRGQALAVLLEDAEQLAALLTLPDAGALPFDPRDQSDIAREAFA